MKKTFITLLIVIVYAFGLYGEAAGSSYLASQSDKEDQNNLLFAKIDKDTTVRFGAYQTQITSTSNPSDPLIGSWQSIYVGGHGDGNQFPARAYDYQLENETSPGSGVWNLSGGEANIYITAAADKPPSNEASAAKGSYLVATATATTINFKTGEISWSTVAVENVNNPFGDKSALSDFSQYATGIFTYTFATSETLRNWIMDTSKSGGGTQSVKFATQLSSSSATAAPEPGTWALILVGLVLLSLGLRNKLQGVAYARQNGHVGILSA